MDITLLILIGLNVLTIIVNLTIFLSIKLNDLRHLSRDVGDIKVEIKEIKGEQKRISDKVIEIDTRCQERHSRKRKKKR